MNSISCLPVEQIAEPNSTSPLNVVEIRARGFAMSRAIIDGLAELDYRISMLSEGTVDDRNALNEAGRRLQLLLESGVAQ